MSSTTTQQAPPPPPAPTAVREAVGRPLRRLRSGELGAWPVIIGLIVIWIVFQTINDRFLTSQNLSNLALQIAGIGTISIGVVLVL